MYQNFPKLPVDGRIQGNLNESLNKVQFSQSPKRKIEYGTAVNLPRPSSETECPCESDTKRSVGKKPQFPLYSLMVAASCCGHASPQPAVEGFKTTIFVSWCGQVGPDIKNDATMCDRTWKLLFTDKPQEAWQNVSIFWKRNRRKLYKDVQSWSRPNQRLVM